jgi:predicted nucleotidyltransferase
MAELNLDRKRKDYQQSLDQSLKSITDQLAEFPGILKVILFGSFASGRKDLFTDLDLVVIMETEKDFIQRTADLYGSIKCEVDLDLLVYTPQEFNTMKERGFLRRALQEGQVIYEK